jgi:superfamily II DNA or RNA helicase
MSTEELKLRRYQESLVSRVLKAWGEGKKNILMQLPTGGGKTACFSSISKSFTSQGQRVLVVAHKEELVLQNAKSLEKWCGQACGLIKAGFKADYSLDLQSASIQTLASRWSRIDDFNSIIGNFNLIIIDECHRSAANIYKPLFSYPNTKILGVSATPERNDKLSLGELYKGIVQGIQTRQLIKRGYLSHYRFFADKKSMEWKGSKLVDGDFSTSDIAERNNIKELSESVVENYRQHGEDGTCLVFALNVQHSLEITEAYNQAGIAAVHLDANSTRKYRREILDKFAAGELKVISNVALFGEGLDIPGLNCIQVVRPTQSLGFHLQMLGRVLRPSEGKKYAIVLDHTDNYTRLGFPDDDRHWFLEEDENDNYTSEIELDEDDDDEDLADEAPVEVEIELIEVTEEEREKRRQLKMVRVRERRKLELEEKRKKLQAEAMKQVAIRIKQYYQNRLKIQQEQRKQYEEQLRLRREQQEAQVRAEAQIKRQLEQEAEVKRQHKIAQQTFLDQRAHRQKERELAAQELISIETRKIMMMLRTDQIKDNNECEAILKERKILEINQLEMEENARKRHLALANLHKKQKWERIRPIVNEESREEAIDRLKEIDDHQYSWFTQSLLLNDLDIVSIKTLTRLYYDIDYSSAHETNYTEGLWNFIVEQLIHYESEGIQNKKWATDLLERMPTPKGIWERIAVAFEYKPGWVHYKTR